MARVIRWLVLLAVLVQAASAATTDCGNSGKVMLTKGTKNNQALVYGTACNSTTLTVDVKSKLTASGLKIQVVQSIPDVVELNLALNSLSAIPAFADAEALTKLYVIHCLAVSLYRNVLYKASGGLTLWLVVFLLN